MREWGGMGWDGDIEEVAVRLQVRIMIRRSEINLAYAYIYA